MCLYCLFYMFQLQFQTPAPLRSREFVKTGVKSASDNLINQKGRCWMTNLDQPVSGRATLSHRDGAIINWTEAHASSSPTPPADTASFTGTLHLSSVPKKSVY